MTIPCSHELIRLIIGASTKQNRVLAYTVQLVWIGTFKERLLAIMTSIVQSGFLRQSSYTRGLHLELKLGLLKDRPCLLSYKL